MQFAVTKVIVVRKSVAFKSVPVRVRSGLPQERKDMKTHNWVKLCEYDHDSGWIMFYKCTDCGANGGPVGYNTPPVPPFLTNTNLLLSYDCHEAMEQIVNFRPQRK